MGQAKVASDQVGVVQHQGLRVGKLGEAAVVEVCGKKWAGADAEEVGSQGGLRVDVLADRGRGGLESVAAEPAFVVGVEGFAIGEAQQGRAVVDFKRKLGGMVRLMLGDGREPGAEGLAILGGVQAEEVGRSVRVAVARVEDEGDRDANQPMAPVQMELGVSWVNWRLQHSLADGVDGFEQS